MAIGPSNRTKQPHFVPETYLKPWSHLTKTRERQCYAHSKDGKTSRPQNIKKFMKEGGLYLGVGRGGRDIKWEDWLTELEASYGPARERLEENGFVTEHSDREVFARFLSTQAHRTPIMRDHLLKQLKIINEIMNSAREHIPFVFSVNNPKKYSLSELKLAQENPMTYILLPEIEFLYSDVCRMHLSIINNYSKIKFFTSDNPIIIMNNWGNSPIRLEGITNPLIEIMMPVSPKKCLMFTWKKLPDVDVTMQYENIVRFNKIIIKNAQRWIVSEDPKLDIMSTDPAMPE